MPGLVGYVTSAGEARRNDGALDAMADALRHHPEHVATAPFADGAVSAGVVLRRRGLGGGHWRAPGDVEVWLDGEIFGESRLLPLEEAAASLADDPGRPLNGAYAAVIYDARAGRLLFQTDPFGLKYLYLRRCPGAVAWAGEVKAFLRAPGDAPTLAPDFLGRFIHDGYPSGNTTWFRGIELVEPGTVLSLDVATGEWAGRRYFDLETAVAEPASFNGDKGGLSARASLVGDLFRRAVARRSAPGERAGVALSGGLDSRAILAAMPAEADPVETVTFGAEGSPDIDLARDACLVRGAHHSVVHIGSNGWLEDRAAGVWLTDGQFDLLHLHGVETYPVMETRMDFCMNGFLGDALLGGWYLHGKGPPVVDRYRHKGRRFILQAMHYGGGAVVWRLPFVDLDLVRALAVPNSWLREGVLYRQMLLREFPEYFATIPWEETGLPISVSPGKEQRSRLVRRARRRLAQLRGGDWSSPSYARYADWLRSGTGAEYLGDLLDRPDARLFSIVPRDDVQRVLARHRGGRDECTLIGRYLTAELWLRRLESEGVKDPVTTP